MVKRCESRARGGSRLTTVFDLDETLFSNWPYLKAGDFGFVLPEWNRWVDEAKAPAIESVREVYRTARRSGVEVIFVVSDRPGSSRRRLADRDKAARNGDHYGRCALIMGTNQAEDGVAASSGGAAAG